MGFKSIQEKNKITFLAKKYNLKSLGKFHFLEKIMLFSIIIPIYKINKYIQKSIESAINQKFSNDKFEVILVNDGSKENFSKIINKFKYFNNFKYFKLKKIKDQG